MSSESNSEEQQPQPSHKQYHATMPKLAIEMNTRVFVRINPVSRLSVPLQGEFLGTSHYDFLIIRLPSVPGLLRKLLPHTRVELRYLSQGAVSTFTTEIISYSYKPTLLLYTTYPDRMSVLETRRHQRLVCVLPTSLVCQQGDAIGMIDDLSGGGCRASVNLKGHSNMRNIAVDYTVMLTVGFMPNVDPVQCICTVRSVEVSGTKLSMGLSFDTGNTVFMESLNVYLDLLKSLS